MQFYDLMNKSIKRKKNSKHLRKKLMKKSFEKDNFEKIGSTSPVTSIFTLDSKKFLLGNSNSVLLYKNNTQAASVDISSFVNR